MSPREKWVSYSNFYFWYLGVLTHWGRVMHICVSNWTIIGLDNGLSPGRRQAIIWTSAGISLIEPLGTNFREILIGIQSFSFKKMRLKMSSAKWRPFCLGLNVLMKQTSYCNHILILPMVLPDAINDIDFIWLDCLSKVTLNCFIYS